MFFIPSSLTLFVYSLLNAKKDFFWKFAVIPSLVISMFIWVANLTLLPSTLYKTPSGFLPKVDGIYLAFLFEMVYCTLFSLVYTHTRLAQSFTREKLHFLWWTILLFISFSTSSALTIHFITNTAYLDTFTGVIVNIILTYVAVYICKTNLPSDIKTAVVSFLSKFITTSIMSFVFALAIAQSEKMPFTISLFLTCIIFTFLPSLIYKKLQASISQAAQKIPPLKTTYTANAYDDTIKRLNDCDDFQGILTILDEAISRMLGCPSYTLLLDSKNINSGIENREDTNHNLSFVNEKSSLISILKRHNDIVFLDEEKKEKHLETYPPNIDILIPLKNEDSLIGALALKSPDSTGFYRKENMSFLLQLKISLGKNISRSLSLQRITQELSDSRKTLSLIELANQYHHDIKTPLAVIDGVISTDIYDEETRRKIVIEQVEKGSQLITTMANMLKGNRKRKISLIDVGEILENCTIIFQSYFDKIDIIRTHEYPMEGDKIDLAILFSNLIKNAAEAGSSDRENTLTITLRRNESNIEIDIQDSGQGMNNETLENLWATKESNKPGGNAIGLQAVKRIAEEHNIAISVESTLNKGTTFHLVCPITPLEKGLAHQASEAKR